ncbi:MAG: hypothetical protein WBV23_03005 [Desulfobaccales bacterium]
MATLADISVAFVTYGEVADQAVDQRRDQAGKRKVSRVMVITTAISNAKHLRSSMNEDTYWLAIFDGLTFLVGQRELRTL